MLLSVVSEMVTYRRHVLLYKTIHGSNKTMPRRRDYIQAYLDSKRAVFQHKEIDNGRAQG